MATVVVTFFLLPRLLFCKMDAEEGRERRRFSSSRRGQRWSMSSQRLEQIVKAIMKPVMAHGHCFDRDDAGLLEEYLTEAGLRMLDEGGAVPNFAEIGMLLQSYACNYSRKVDHLINLAYRFRSELCGLECEGSPAPNPETEASPRRRRTVGGGGGGGGEFLPIVLTPASLSVRRAPSPAGPPPALPRQYSELSPREPRPDRALHADFSREPIGSLDDFYVSRRTRRGFLVDELEADEEEEDQEPEQPLPMLQLQAAVERNAAGSPSPAPPASPSPAPPASTPPALPASHPPAPPASPPSASPPPASPRAPSTPPPASPRAPSTPPPASPRVPATQSAPSTPPSDLEPLYTSTPLPTPPLVLKRNLTIASEESVITLDIDVEMCRNMPPREFALPRPWVRRVVRARRDALLSVRRSLSLSPSAPDFRGFDTTWTDIGGFRGWARAEGIAARAAVRRMSVALLADSDDDGFFERSSDSLSPSMADRPLAAVCGMSETGSWQEEVVRRAALEAPLDLNALARDVRRALPPPPAAPVSWPTLLARLRHAQPKPSRVLLDILSKATRGQLDVLPGVPGRIGDFSVRLRESSLCPPAAPEEDDPPPPDP